MIKPIANTLSAALLGGALTFISAGAVGATVLVQNLQPITEGMKQPIVLKVTGSDAGCSYLAQLVRRVQSDPTSWILKSERRSCMKTSGGDLVIMDVQALVPLDKLPIPRNSELTLYQRDIAR